MSDPNQNMTLYWNSATQSWERTQSDGSNPSGTGTSLVPVQSSNNNKALQAVSQAFRDPKAAGKNLYELGKQIVTNKGDGVTINLVNPESADKKALVEAKLKNRKMENEYARRQQQYLMQQKSSLTSSGTQLVASPDQEQQIIQPQEELKLEVHSQDGNCIAEGRCTYDELINSARDPSEGVVTNMVQGVKDFAKNSWQALTTFIFGPEEIALPDEIILTPEESNSLKLGDHIRRFATDGFSTNQGLLYPDRDPEFTYQFYMEE